MKDDAFELLTKMYADFTLQFKEVRGDISELKGDVSTLKGSVSKLESSVSKLESSVSKLESSVSKIELKLENETNKKIDILLETRSDVNNRLDIIENKIDILSEKVDKHDIEIKVIKAAK